MDCSEFKNYIDDNLIEKNENLDGEHRLHLDECESCREFYFHYQKLEKGFDNLRNSLLPEDFHENLMEEINPKNHHVSILLRNKKLGVVAALFIIFFSSYAVYDYTQNANFDKVVFFGEMAMDSKDEVLYKGAAKEESFENKSEAKKINPSEAKVQNKEEKIFYEGIEADKEEKNILGLESNKGLMLSNEDDSIGFVLNGQNLRINEDVSLELITIINSSEEVKNTESLKIEFQDDLTYKDKVGIAKIALQSMSLSDDLSAKKGDYYFKKNGKIYKVDKKFYEILRTRK